MEKYAINYKNQVIRFYGYDYNSKDYYAMIDRDVVSAKNLKELCNKIGLSHTALHRDVCRNDIVKY
jgi:hypothetical protein